MISNSNIETPKKNRAEWDETDEEFAALCFDNGEPESEDDDDEGVATSSANDDLVNYHNMTRSRAPIRTSITVKHKMKARKSEYQEVAVENLAEFVEKNPHSHEIIYGPCKPYYDYDPLYGSEQKAKDQFFHDHELAYKTLANFYGKGEVLSFCAPGKTLDKHGNTMWKNSFHFRIRNWGYFESAAYIPRFAIFDQQVYCERLTCQTASDEGVKSVRLPYCSKEGSDRVLRRLLREETVRGVGMPNDVKLTVLSLSDCDIHGEGYHSWCPTYTEGEKFRTPTDKVVAEVVGRTRTQNENNETINAALTAGKYPRRSTEQIRDIVECIGVNRSEYNERMSIVFGLSQIARSQGMMEEIRPIAHEFAERIKGSDYNKSEVDSWFDSEKVGTSFGSVIFKAKEDSPDASWAWLKVKRVQAVAPDSPTFYEDKYKLLDDDPTEADVQTWMMGCLVYIEMEERWYSRYRAGWKPVPVASKSKNLPFSTDSSKSTIPVSTQVKGKPVIVDKQFSDILRALNQSTAFDGCRFIEATWMPYFKVAPTGVFNLWSGWLHPIDDEIVSPDDLDIKRIISHLHDLCGRDDKGVLYYIKYLASIIQRPTEKRPTIVFYSEKQGNGKSWWILFMLEYVLGAANVLTTPNPDVVIAHFNALAAEQLLTVFEEARPPGDNSTKSILTNQMFKDMQTNKRLALTGKCKDSKKGFNISCYHILTNFLAALMLEATDRRTVLYKCNCEHVGDRAYFDAMRAQLEKPEVGKKWLNYLAQMDLTGFDAWALPESELKDKVKARSLNVVLEHIKAIVEGERTITIPIGGQAFGIKTLYHDFKLYCDEIGIQKTYTKGQKAYKDEIEQALGLEYKRHDTTDDEPERIMSFWFEIDDLETRFQSAVGLKTFKFDMA